MTKLDKLYGFAHSGDINIINAKFSQTKKAACMSSGIYKNIIMDKSAIVSANEEVGILAEEIGHYATGALYSIKATYNTPIARSNRIKYEAKARRWAITSCLPVDEIEKAVSHAAGDKYLAAEYCQVTVEFLDNAVEHYRACGVIFTFDCDIL